MDAFGKRPSGRNELSGNSVSGTVYGSVAQIVENHGGVHIHEAPPPRVVPRCLPRGPARLVDRRDAIERLEQLRRVDSPVIVVSGLGGIGKTALVLHWLHSIAGEYHDGHLYYDLNGAGAPAEAAEVLPELLRQLGVPPQYVPATRAGQEAEYRSRTAARRLVVFLDHAITAAQVRPLLPAAGGSLVVITSRRRLSALAADGATPIELDLLDPAAAVEMLKRLLPDGETEVLRTLAEHSGYLPLALQILGTRLANCPEGLPGIADRLAEARRRLDLLQAGEDPGVRANFEDSFRDLPAGAARLFAVLGLHPGGSFGLGAAAALAGLFEDDTAELLDVLVDRSLLTGDDDRYGFHDLLRDYARERAANDLTQEERDVALRRVVDWYLAGAAAADSTIGPGRWRLGPAFRDARPLAGKDAAWEWLERERPNLRAAVEAAHARGWHEHVWWLCEALWYLYFLRKYYRDWRDTHELGVDSAVRCGDGAAEARMRTQLGFALLDQGRGDEAVREFTAARDAARSAGHRQGEATAVESLGLALLRERRWDKAIEALETNLRLAEETGDPRAILLSRHHLGRAISGAGDHDRAIDLLTPLPDAFLALDDPDPYNRGRSLTSLGEAYLRAGRTDAAINFFGQALDIMRGERATEQQADLWCHLADAARSRHDPDAERGALTEARTLYESLGSPKATDVAARLEQL